MSIIKTRAKMSDQELIKSIKNGDKESYRYVVEKYKSTIIGTIYNMVGFTAEADDVAQEVFIRFYNNIDNFRGDASLKTYLTRIAINLSLNEIKRKKNRQFDSIDNIENVEFNTNSSDYEKMEKKDLVQRALMSLEPTYKSIINLRLIEEFSTRETAEILNIPEGTVLSRLSRAQQKLKEALDQILGEKNG